MASVAGEESKVVEQGKASAVEEENKAPAAAEGKLEVMDMLGEMDIEVPLEQDMERRRDAE
jgi:hypothetical protein